MVFVFSVSYYWSHSFNGQSPHVFNWYGGICILALLQLIMNPSLVH